MATNKVFPVLYILMRTDLESLNPGKMAAQASHASNAFVHAWDERDHDSDVDDLGVKWLTSTKQGFGTVLVLGVNEKQMRIAVEVAQQLEYPAEVIHDPTYPIRDGEVCHFLPIDTCAYVFGDKDDPILKSILGNFNLHP